MKKRFLRVTLAVLLIVCCLTSTAFAAGSTDILGQIEDYFDNITLGDVLRSFSDATGFKDAYHVVSAEGEPVTLSVSNLVGDINGILKAAKKYEMKYQWYSCSSVLMTNPKPISGANGTTLQTERFNGTGLKYYFCKISLYQKIGLLKPKVGEYRTPTYVVGYTGLPVIYVNTPNGKVITSNEEWIEGADIKIVGGPNEDYDLDTTEIRIKGRGNLSWRSSSKNGYTIKFDKKQDVFGIGKDKTWALVANFCDKALLRNWLAAELDRNVFDNGSEWNVTQHHVDLVINGEYRGNYTLATTIRIGDNRVDIPDISDEITKDRNKDGVIDFYDAGFVVEINDSLDEKYNFTTEKGVSISLSDPDLDDDAENNEAIYQHIKAVVQNAENALYSENFTDPETGYAKYIDVESFIDHYLLQELSKNRDGHFNRSIYMYYQPKDGKIHIASSWDFDIAFGNNSAGDCDLTDGISCNGGWYTRMFEDPAFVEKLVERWNEAKPEIESFVKNDLPQQTDAIRTSANLNFAKWPILGLYVERCPRDFYTRWTYQAEVDYLKNWTLKRVQWLDGAYNDMLA